ncbi:MAG: lysylphosphatidylglycerol synthase transmembrane domain-containing protein [Bryobacteraceae bacterium]
MRAPIVPAPRTATRWTVIMGGTGTVSSVPRFRPVIIEFSGDRACMNRDLGKSSRVRVPSWLLPAIGCALSAVSLVWVFRGFNLEQTLSDLASLDWRFVTLAVVADLAIYFCGGWRWGILLQPVSRVSYWRAVQAIYIGLYANEILPLRPGEVIRCYLLLLWEKVPMSLALSAAAIERILEGVWLTLAFLITAFFIKLPGGLVHSAQVLGVLVVLLLATIGFIAKRKHEAHAVVSGSRWGSFLRHVVEGVHDMGNLRTMLWASWASLVYMALQIVPVWALMVGYGLDLSVWAASAVLIIIRLGTLIPNLPGNAGLYQAMCVLALGLFDVPKPTAVGFSFMMFGVLTLPLLIGGFVAVALSGLKLGQIRSQARSSVDAGIHVREN